MQFGVHLPQLGWDDEAVTFDRVMAVARAAERLGFGCPITANDHLVYGRPWLDGPTALAAALAAAPTVRLMTSVALPVVRGPFALAKSLGAIDLLSRGRLDAGLGPGSSEADYKLAVIPFTERWARFDESVATIRALWDRDLPPFVGQFYDTTGVTMAPLPGQPKGPPIFIGSWGSAAGMRRVARLAEAQAVTEKLSVMLRRPVEEVAGHLPIGSPAMCLDLLGRYQDVGLERVLLWPLMNEVHQLERVAAEIIPHLGRAT